MVDRGSEFSWFCLPVWPVREKEQTLRQLVWNFEWLVHACVLSHFSCVLLFATLWTTARQAPLSMVFPRQEYWSGLPYPPSGDLPGPGINLSSLMSPALAGWFFTTVATWEALSDRLLIQVSIELVIRHSIFALCYHVECQDSNYMICL